MGTEEERIPLTETPLTPELVSPVTMKIFNEKSGQNSNDKSDQLNGESLTNVKNTMNNIKNVITAVNKFKKRKRTKSGTSYSNRKYVTQIRLNSHLLISIEDGKTEEAIALIIEGASVNATCRESKCCALALAITLGLEKVVQELIKRKVNVDCMDKNGLTVFHYAAYLDELECLDLVLEYMRHTNAKLLKQLLNICAVPPETNEKNPNDLDNLEHDCKNLELLVPLVDEGCTALHLACQTAHLPIIKKLIFHGSDLNIADKRGCMPMNVIGEDFLSADYTPHDIELFYQTIKYFINRKAQFTESNDSNYKEVISVLHTAIYLNHTKSVQDLIYYNMSPYTTLNTDGDTALHYAIQLERLDILKLLTDTWKHDSFEGEYDAKDTESTTSSQYEKVFNKNKAGFTPFQLAVERQWIPGIYMLLEIGADVTEKSNSGDTALHLAAKSGNCHLVDELLKLDMTKVIINEENKNRETPLFCAIQSGKVNCVKSLIGAGANIYTNLNNNRNVLHECVQNKYNQILKLIIEHNSENNLKRKSQIENMTPFNERNWFNQQEKETGMAPLHLATFVNSYSCVKTLLDTGFCDLYLKTIIRIPIEVQSGCETLTIESLPIHIAAARGYSEILELLLKQDSDQTHSLNSYNWSPLHISSFHGHTSCIKTLLKYGGDLSLTVIDPKYKMKTNSLDMIMKNVNKPVDFLEDLLDECVTTNEFSLSDPRGCVYVNYDILIPKPRIITPVPYLEGYQFVINDENPTSTLRSNIPKSSLTSNMSDLKDLNNDLKVINCLLKTGNKYGQKSLLIHPVIESFLYMKWKSCKFIYFLFFLYSIFVTMLTAQAYVTFYLTDASDNVKKLWSYLLIFPLFSIMFLEIWNAKQYFQNYLMDIETYIKWLVFVFVCILVCVREPLNSVYEWPRHLTAIALLLAWIELMLIFSRFSIGGHYVLMFFRVAKNIAGVLLTFTCLIIGFAFSFLIEFHGIPPFGSIYESIAKTIVMMTSEYDYTALFDKPHDYVWLSTLIVGRLVMVLFVVLISMVLMNLMIGLAVSDIADLKLLGRTECLEKQVYFLYSLERKKWLQKVENVDWFGSSNNVHLVNNSAGNNVLVIHSRRRNRGGDLLSDELRESLIDLAEENKIEDVTLNSLSEQIKLIHKDLLARIEVLNRMNYVNRVQSSFRASDLNKANRRLKLRQDVGNKPF